MPRSGVLGTYSLPPGTTPQTPGTTITSAIHNAAFDDVQQTFNTPTPVSYGGTGGETATEALTNLGVSSFVQGSLDEADGNAFFNALGGSRNTSAQGYTKLPNGIILQWGSGTIDAGTINFPLVFPSACRSVVATTNANGARMPAVDDITSSSFSLRMFSISGVVSSAGYNYFAIGY